VSKELTVEELRERPDALIEAIDEGEAVTITRDGKEIATTNPVRRTGGYKGVPYPFRDIKITPLKKPLSRDPVELLREDRDHDPLGDKYGS
jgi:antitoxin (DNA-binding transcriptional repressor) of toxin-antitoxin stability system